MSASFNVLGYIRGILRRPFSGTVTPQNVDLNAGGDLIVSQGLPERTEIVRMGNSFSCQQPLGSGGFTLVAAVPTTLAEMSLQNGESVASNKCYVIERYWFKHPLTTATLGCLTPMCQVVPPGTALVADDATILRVSLSGKTAPATRTKAQIVLHSILTGCIGDQWIHHQSIEDRATTNIATVVEVNCLGRYIIPPQGNFSINCEVSIATGKGLCGIEWHEVVMDVPTA